VSVQESISYSVIPDPTGSIAQTWLGDGTGVDPNLFELHWVLDIVGSGDPGETVTPTFRWQNENGPQSFVGDTLNGDGTGPQTASGIVPFFGASPDGLASFEVDYVSGGGAACQYRFSVVLTKPSFPHEIQVP